MSRPVPSKLDLLSASVALQSRAMALLYLSDRQKSAGQLEEAAGSYQQLIAVLRQQLETAELNNRHYPDTPFALEPIVGPLLNAQLTLADVLEALGKAQQAEALREEAVELSERYLPGSGAAERHRQRAQSLLAQSRYPEALVALHQALDEFKRQGDVLQVASVTRNIAEVLEWLGDYARALSEAEAAARLIEPLLEGKEPSEQAVAEALYAGRWKAAEEQAKLLQVWLDLEQIVGRASRRLGRLDEAEARFRKVLPRVPPGGEPGIEFQFAAIHVARGAYRQALAELQRLEPFFTGLARPKLGVLQSWKAEALLGLGRPGEALPQAESAVRELVTYRDTDSLWKAQWRLARVLSAAGREPDALAAYQQAAQTVTTLRRAPLGYRLDSTYMADKLPLFQQAIDLACRLGDAEAGGSLIEYVKSRALIATLTAPAVQARGEEGNLARQVEALSRQLDALEYFVYRHGPSEPVEQTRAQLLQQRFSLLERIRFSDPRWRSLSAPPPFAVGTVLDALAGRNQAALTLFCAPDRIVAVLLKDRACRIDSQPLSDEVAAALDRYRAGLQSEQGAPAALDPATSPALSADRLVPGELLEQALQSESLVIAPHGPLHLLPWAGLVFGGQRLFQRCPVGILPNLTCAVVLQAQLDPHPQVALVGAPAYRMATGLPELLLAEDELRTIEEIYAPHGRVVGDPLIGEKATQAGFWDLVQQEGASGAILHMACHGAFETGEPLNSGLLLADGRLDAAEIARRLPFSEVALSACFSGYRPTEVQGVPLSGDDVLGLPGAFLEAGAHSVLVSITRARDDAALRLMTLYHEQRASGVAPLPALQAAQRAMADSPRYPAHLWIGFTLYGCQ